MAQPGGLLPDLDPPLPKWERFEVRRRLGAGSFGLVCEAFDRRRNEVVALKVLHKVDPSLLYHFKGEFRALADVVHPNLVALHELLRIEESWALTMELVVGTDFVSYVRAPPTSVRQSRIIRRFSPFDEGVPAAPGAVPELPATAADIGRLRAALRQLASGVAAIHAAGKLHRDLKPANVLVDKEGRVVVLDFGLAVELETAGPDGSHRPTIGGTVAYMAPEQADGRKLSAAADWYAVGVMMHEALVGKVPFDGSILQILSAKEATDAPAPGKSVRGVPEDLDALCAALMRRDPLARPSGLEVLKALGAAPPARSADSGRLPIVRVGLGGGLLGREPELLALRDAFERTCVGVPVTVFVTGAAGSGKTALVKKFLDGLAARGEAVCLMGRCHERESVPFKTLDGLIDALTRHLRRLPRPEVESLLPANAHAIARLFPVLERVEAIAQSQAGHEAVDPLELRRRCVMALKGLLARISERRRLVLAIDDLQWGDVDGAALCLELMRPPGAPAALLVGSYRSEDAERSPALRTLLAAEADPGAGELREVVVGPLPEEAARDLALLHLSPDVPPEALESRRDVALEGTATPPPASHSSSTVSRTLAEQAAALEIARESGGDPLLLIELARHVRDGSSSARSALGKGVSLESMIRARIDALAPEARRLLEAVAVAGRPLERAVAARAAQVEPEKERALSSTLRAQNLVRAQASRERDELEVYHNRVREAVVASLEPPALRERHRALAFAITSSERPDHKALTVHFLAAGEDALAARHAIAAAELATRALAFDRAASLYRIALDVGAKDSPERRTTQVRLADTLVATGRGAEAARIYLESVAGAPPGEALELRRRAAEQLLRSGHIDEGLAVVADVLRAIGMRLSTPRRAVLSLLWRRLMLRIRGLGFKERAASEVPAEELHRIDICSTISAALSTVDTIRGADFQTRNLLLSLRAGEPLRIAAALAFETGYSSTAGASARERTARVINTARGLAERLKDPRTTGIVTLAEGVAAYCEGRFAEAHERCDAALAVLRERCSGVAWEIATCHLFAAWGLLYTGKLRLLAERVWATIREADERGDVYAAANLHSGLGHFPMLMADDPAGARRVTEEGLARWTHKGFDNQHAVSADWCGQIHLYMGDGPAAWKVAIEVWEPARRAYVLEIQFFRVFLPYLRGRAAVATAARAGAAERARFLADADRAAALMERERAEWGVALARLVRGGAAVVRGAKEAALAQFRAAAKELSAHGMEMHAAVARRRQGEVMGGGQGTLLVLNADAWMSSQGIKNPARWAAMLAPAG